MTEVIKTMGRAGPARDAGRLAGLRAGTLLLLMTVLGGCGTESDVPLETLAGTPPPVEPARLAGRITDALTSAELAGVTVSLGDVSGTSDADGEFLISDVPVGSNGLVHFSAAGYLDGYVFTTTRAGRTAVVTPQLLPVAATVIIDAGTGGTAAVAASTAEVTVPAAALETEAGTPATGNVTLALTPINMAQNLPSSPGAFVTPSNQLLESLGGFAVTATDSGGAPVQLATGQTATIRIPVSSRGTGTPPATLSLFRFDATAGNWVAGGTATLAGTAPDQYYEGSVSQLGIWMAGSVVAPTVTLTGCVAREDTGARVAQVRVQAEGISYSSISAAITDSNGNFSLPIKSGSQVIVNGQIGNYVTNTLSATGSASTVALPQCLSLASLSGAPRITLSWGEQPTDADSHLFAPDGTHVYYSNLGTLSAAPYIKLDVDDVTSYGPEVFTVTRLMVGTYTYGVRNFSGDGLLTASPVRVELRRGMELTTFTPTAAMGETATHDWWTVFTFTVDAACNVTVTPVNVFSTGGDDGPAAPARPTPVTRQYCTP